MQLTVETKEMLARAQALAMCEQFTYEKPLILPPHLFEQIEDEPDFAPYIDSGRIVKSYIFA